MFDLTDQAGTRNRRTGPPRGAIIDASQAARARDHFLPDRSQTPSQAGQLDCIIEARRSA